MEMNHLENKTQLKRSGYHKLAEDSNADWGPRAPDQSKTGGCGKAHPYRALDFISPDKKTWL